MLPVGTTDAWAWDWFWGLLLVTVSLVAHAFGLGLIRVLLARCFDSTLPRARRGAHFSLLFPVVIGFTALLLATLHGIEASLWAAAYVWLDAVPDFARAMYFSLQMITTLGADVINVDARWRLMGPLEAICGMLVFGLSTAFLLAVFQRAWPFSTSTERKD
jgi:hypothetical protein